MNAFLTIKEEYSETTKVIKSEFLTIVKRVRNEDEMFVALKEIRKTYSNATHVCYAAIFDKFGLASRFSDDGEPSGTAGQPIFDALKKSGLKETLVAVVRWFGGVKLGAGGLVRAYSSSASSALKNANKAYFELCDIYEIRLDFAHAKKFSSVVARMPFDIITTEYGMDVKYIIAAVEHSEVATLIADAMGCKPNLIKIGTRFIERPKMEK